MTQPRVAAVMLTTGSRPAMLKRAIQCFQSQTYPNKILTILHSGPELIEISNPHTCIRNAGSWNPPMPDNLDIIEVAWRPGKQRSIGELRNIANALTPADAEVLVHFDDDDFSHPERLTEQVAMLQETGAEAVGYSEMLFWDTRPGAFCGAWLYSSPNQNICLGTSFCYRRKAWEAVPFRNKGEGEDHQWYLDISAKRMKFRGTSAGVAIPRMIASIHGGNSFAAIAPGVREWRRATEYDQICRETMK